MWCIMVMRLTVCVVYYGDEADCMTVCVVYYGDEADCMTCMCGVLW